MRQRSIYDLLEQLYRARTITETHTVSLNTFVDSGWQKILNSDPSRVALTIQNISTSQTVTYRVGENLIGGGDFSGFMLTRAQSYSVNALFDFAQPSEDIYGYSDTNGGLVIIQEALITPPLNE